MTLPAARIRALTRRPEHHFFGYYGICPWNRAGDRLLCLETPFQHRMPRPGEAARVGLVDAATGAFEAVAETRAWNLQQGAMLHWHPHWPDTRLLYNDVQEGELVSVVLDLLTGRKRLLPRPLSAMSHDGRSALSLTYGRLARMRTVVGYAGLIDPHADNPHPDEDGVWGIDLESGDCRLLVSIGEVFRGIVDRHPEIQERHMWFNHVAYSRDDSRFFFLARTWEDGRLQTGMWTADARGGGLREAVPYGWSVSHFDWRSRTEIGATFRLGGSGETGHYLFTDGEADYCPLGAAVLRGDGHLTFSPDGVWLVTDQNHRADISKSLWLLRVVDDEGRMLGRFPMRDPQYLHGDTRCDLHPRWNHDGTAVCFDALAEDGTRQLHVAILDL